MPDLRPRKKKGNARIDFHWGFIRLPVWRAKDVGQATVKIAAFKRKFKRGN